MASQERRDVALLACDYSPSADRWVHSVQSVTVTLTAAATALGRETMEAVGRRMDTTAPVDTGALKRNRRAVQQTGPLTWETGYDLPYAPILEYGAYRGVGPKTVALGGGDLGAEFVAGAGIYSKQAPLGWVRKALVSQAKPLRKRLATAVHAAWGGRRLSAGAGALPTDTQTLSQIFGVEVI